MSQWKKIWFSFGFPMIFPFSYGMSYGFLISQRKKRPEIPGAGPVPNVAPVIVGLARHQVAIGAQEIAGELRGEVGSFEEFMYRKSRWENGKIMETCHNHRKIIGN